MAAHLRQASPKALGQALVDRVQTLPSMAQNSSRVTMASSLEQQYKGSSGYSASPNSFAAAYKDITDLAFKLHEKADGVLGPKSPITKIFDALEGNPAKQKNIQGYIFEIETANKLYAQGYKIEAFGKNYYVKEVGVPREFDLFVSKNGQKTLIECKNLDWNASKMESKMGVIGQQQKIATSLGYGFEVHSKQPIPEAWKVQFRKMGIRYRETGPLKSPQTVKECAFCNEIPQKLQRCSQCKAVHYCGVSCQKSDWVYHESTCKPRSK